MQIKLYNMVKNPNWQEADLSWLIFTTAAAEELNSRVDQETSGPSST